MHMRGKTRKLLVTTVCSLWFALTVISLLIYDDVKTDQQYVQDTMNLRAKDLKDCIRVPSRVLQVPSSVHVLDSRVVHRFRWDSLVFHRELHLTTDEQGRYIAMQTNTRVRWWPTLLLVSVILVFCYLMSLGTRNGVGSKKSSDKIDL
jgi:hypothetical protein